MRNMRSLILPVAGKSSRYPDVKPKWLSTHPSGSLMITESIKGLNLDFFDCVYLVCLKEHERKYKFSEGIKKEFSRLNIKNFKITYLSKPTLSQPETIFEAIKKEKITGFFCSKDCDNFFEIKITASNFVSTSNLNNHTLLNPCNKSYVSRDENNNINNIVEKQVISSDFCTGCYGFKNARDFRKYYNKIKHYDDLYVSHVIYKMIIEGESFTTIDTNNFIDWGTIDDWNHFKSKYKCIFIDLDGTLVENSAQHFPPYWGETDAIPANVKKINELYDSGKAQVVITTSRKRGYKKETKSQLERIGLKYHKIIFDLFHCKRYIINDYAKSNPYPSCEAINIKRNDSNLEDLL